MRRIIIDTMGYVLGSLVQAAKKSPVGAMSETSDREFLEAVLHRAKSGRPLGLRSMGVLLGEA